MNQEKVVSQFDQSVYNQIRSAVREFQIDSLSLLTSNSLRVLDIAPQTHEGISNLAPTGIEVETIDIDSQYKPTYVGDICAKTSIPNAYFDAVFCTEVLEHVSNPFLAINEIRRVLKPGGYLFASSPFGFRIHGPLPDNWRISEHGWRELLKAFEKIKISPLEDPNRFLMPLHYCVSAKKLD
jgi:2-polyprenyl-3-methyl-5-hydroxy-6-metoxy-1,4-benzoquinol methylase